MTKLVDNLKGPLLTALATINGTVTKIVTKTENIARGTTDPEIDFVTWIKFRHLIMPHAFI